MTLTGHLVDSISKDILEAIESPADSPVDVMRLSKKLMVLENISNADLRKLDSVTNSDIENMKKQVAQLNSSYREANTSGIVQSVAIAEKSRIDKLEHETMAKLVNNLKSKPELGADGLTVGASIECLSQESEALDRAMEIRRLAACVLSQLVRSIQASLLVEPKEEDLPPLSEIDPTSFILE